MSVSPLRPDTYSPENGLTPTFWSHATSILAALALIAAAVATLAGRVG